MHPTKMQDAHHKNLVIYLIGVNPQPIYIFTNYNIYQIPQGVELQQVRDILRVLLQ